MSKLQNWGTPQYVFDYFNSRFCYDLDICAEPWSAKCPDYCSLPDRDAFRENITGRRVWCNPPYDKIHPWILSAAYGNGFADLDEPCDIADIYTLLVPARTDQIWFQDLFQDNKPCCRIEFIRGRLKFVPPPGWEGQINPKTGKIQKATSCEFPCIALHFGASIENEITCIEIPRQAHVRVSKAVSLLEKR